MDTHTKLRELSLFSGGGGGLLATKHLLHWHTVCYVEYAPFPVEILKARIRDGLLDDAPIWDNVRTFDGFAWRGHVDVITAGFPCQPFSAAGKRKADSDMRNGWPSTIRIIREVQPRYCLLENVPGLLSARGADNRPYFGRILADLAESGFNAGWRVLSAAETGAAHKRDRLWIVAYTKGVYRRDKRKNATNGERRQRGNVTMQSIQNKVWEFENAELHRSDDGVAHRVDRLKAIGNGQVPIVAATVWRLLTEDFEI